MVFVGFAIGADRLFSGVYRGVVSLVVNEKQWKIGDEAPTRGRVCGVGDMAPDPFQEPFQNGLVFLDDE